MAGVGMTPASRTSTPDAASPAETAALRNSPETRGVAGDARRPADGPARAAPPPCVLGEDDGARLREVQGQVSGEITVGQAPNPVGSEEIEASAQSRD